MKKNKIEGVLDATGVVLAGGRSSRMGQDKRFLPFDSQTVLESVIASIKPIFKQIIIGIGHQESQFHFDGGIFTGAAFAGVTIVRDELPGQGPLMGIYSCLKQSVHEINFVTACDIPTLDENFVRGLVGALDSADAAVPSWSNGFMEPLLAVYRRTVTLRAAQKRLALGNRRIQLLFDDLKIRRVQPPSEQWYCNVNTPADYEAVIRKTRS